MTLDFALRVPAMRDVALWRECRREHKPDSVDGSGDWRYTESPADLREQACEVLAVEVERQQKRWARLEKMLPATALAVLDYECLDKMRELVEERGTP